LTICTVTVALAKKEGTGREQGKEENSKGERKRERGKEKGEGKSIESDFPPLIKGDTRYCKREQEKCQMSCLGV